MADLGLTAKTRPIVIDSRFDPNPPRALVIYVPLTTQNSSRLFEVELPKLSFLNAASFANVQGTASIPNLRLERKLGILQTATLDEIRLALQDPEFGQVLRQQL